MVLNKHGATLYQGVSKLVAEHLETLAATDIIPTFPTSTADTTMQSTEEELLLKAIKKVWDDHSSSMFRLGQILKYMVGASVTAPTNDSFWLNHKTRTAYTFQMHMFLRLTN